MLCIIACCGLPVELSAAEPVAEGMPWEFVQSRPLIKLSTAERKLEFRAYFDRRRERLLLEGNGHIAFFLPFGSYAVFDGTFQRLARPPVVRDAKFYLDAAVLQAHMLPFVPEEKRSWLQQELRDAFARIQYPLCALERPVKRVFIDPGHGGEDKGAVHGGVAEKKIVLDFAKIAAKALEEAGFEVLLSRKKDEFIELDLRPQLAAEWKADVFVSVHANASAHSGVRGLETYILSSDATDDAARKLAIAENTYRKKFTERSRAEATLDNILWDIGQTAYLQDSAYLAADIQNSLYAGVTPYLQKRKIRWRNRGVREAPFLVLSRAAMPAVLVELAYLSNAKDRTLLRQKRFMQELAKALTNGVKKYAAHCQPKAKPADAKL